MSCEDVASYDALIIRLISADLHPKGRGWITEPVESAIEGSYPGREQAIPAGSWGLVPSKPCLCAESFALNAWVWPTTPLKGEQVIMARMTPDGARGWSLGLDLEGALAMTVVTGKGSVTFSSGVPLLKKSWCFVGASVDGEAGTVTVWQRPQKVWPGYDSTADQASAFQGYVDCGGLPLSFGARYDRREGRQTFGQGRQTFGQGHYNGKIDRPRLANKSLSRAEMEAAKSATIPDALRSHMVGWWNFSRDISGTCATDISPNRLHGEIVNLPTRGMRGHNWTGREHSWRHAPEEYGAIHFHDDDLYDAGWQTDFSLTIPESMASGVYCARLRGAGDEERIPFFVRPPAGKITADAVLLISTATYMAYANMQWSMNTIFAEPKGGGITVLGRDDVFLQENPGYGLSLYDKHSDQTGVCYTSRLRPIFNMRPKTGVWSFNADTHVTDWLEKIGQGFDVVTDEDIHQEGLAAIEPYRVVITGAHPEYWTTPMWDAMVAYQGQGGRLMYLGGNGFYWRIAYHDALPGVLELRRAEGGMRYQTTEPGEYHQSFNGELGGLWRRLGAPPNTLVGAGTVGTGFDSASYYRRTEDSHDPRATFIFEGVGDDEMIGDFGSLLGGAAGVELDGANRKLGTPPHALVVARSEGHSQLYFLCPEETPFHHPVMSGAENPRVRADLLFYETPAGGGVFTTGSISWCASLAHDDYENNVARITGNVLQRFLDPEPL